jgi:cellulose synthase/poly-beta-1,6-N-acetylglucosamine synthase-like glycosyltransferase
MEAGYQTRYVATVVSKGICPETYSQFVTQQYRWCNGSTSLLFSRRFHRLKLTKWQRVSYWSGFLFYISTALDVITTVLPSLLMAFFAAKQVAVENYVFVMLALVVRQALIPFITSDGDSLVNIARIQTVYSFAHLVQLWDLARGRDAGWVATGAAGTSSTARRIVRVARVWLISSQVLLWAAIIWRVPQYGLGNYWPMIAFALFNLYITYPVITASEVLPRTMQLARRVSESGRVRELSAR